MVNKKLNSKINKQKEIEQKRRKRRRIVLKTILISIIPIAILIFLLTSKSFDIKDIEIKGNKQLKQEEIYNISEIEFGDNIFSTISIVAKVRLKENGYIKEANVKKIYPNKVIMEVEERQIQYQILTQEGEYIYIDEQGYIIDCSSEKKDVIVITGMSIKKEDIQKVKRLEEKDLDKMEKILHINDETKKIEMENSIQQIDTEEEFVLHLDNDYIIINLGNATNLNDRMFYVRAILKQEKGNSGTIYVNGNINEGFSPYFKAN